MKVSPITILSIVAVCGLVSVVFGAPVPPHVRGQTARMAAARASTTYTASVYYGLSVGKFDLVEDVLDPEGSIAWGQFQDALNETGWGVLDVTTSNDTSVPDADKMYAAGMLEGYLTARRIYENYLNMKGYFFGSDPQDLQNVSNFLAFQDGWARQQIEAYAGTGDVFWTQAGFLMQQLDGLQSGYQLASQTASIAVPALDAFAFQMLGAMGDVLDIIPAVQPQRRKQWATLKTEDAIRFRIERELCSAIIKVTGDFSDLFMSHSSWFTFSAMNRIYKTYKFNLQDASNAAKLISFSSYPGTMVSIDDFYMMDSGLGMTQTTNGFFNHTLYEFVTPKSMLAWQRVRIANSAAHSGEEWFNLFRQHASGTYANQYMIVDFKLFTPGRPLPDNLLWVVEEMPSIALGKDVTETLMRGYWPSYNRPYFREIFEVGGFADMVVQHGVYFSYQLSPRAKIYRRDQGKIVDVNTLKQFMRYNDWQHDPYSQHNPSYTVCARGDLDPMSPRPVGCYDTKITSNTMFQTFAAQAINGPTTYDGQPPFSWAPFSKSYHYGLPEVFNFSFVDMKPNL